MSDDPEVPLRRETDALLRGEVPANGDPPGLLISKPQLMLIGGIVALAICASIAFSVIAYIQAGEARDDLIEQLQPSPSQYREQLRRGLERCAAEPQCVRGLRNLLDPPRRPSEAEPRDRKGKSSLSEAIEADQSALVPRDTTRGVEGRGRARSDAGSPASGREMAPDGVNPDTDVRTPPRDSPGAPPSPSKPTNDAPPEAAPAPLIGVGIPVPVQVCAEQLIRVNC